jgi:hypothetical protein
MKKTQAIILFICFALNPYAQEISPTLSIDEVYTKIAEIINSANQSLTKDCDPYGFQLSVKVSTKEGGEVSNVVNSGAILLMVEGMLASHKFDRFNLDQPLKPFGKNGIMYFSAGLTPQNTTNETFAVYSHTYTCKESKNGEFRSFTIQIGAQFIIETPKDGGIAGDVFYKTKDGSDAPFSDKALKSSSGERKVRFRRLGPGDESANSGDPEKEVDWKPFQGNQSNFDITSLTPGHYFPSVKLNGCIQKLEDPDKNKDQELILKTKGTINWDNPTKGQKTVKPDNVTAEKILKAEVFTTFSIGNTVDGFIVTPSQRIEEWRDSDFIIREEVQLLKGNQKVWIEPYGWKSNDPIFPKDVMAKDGQYKFEDIPSGVYKVYIDGLKESGKVVEVCNCDPITKEPKSPNRRYQQNLGAVGYQIELKYDYNHPKGKLGFTAIWDNVVIAFGVGEKPQKFSVGNAQNWEGIPKDSLGNVLDVNNKILQPPFIMLERPDQEIICSDIFKYHGPPKMERNTGADGFWEEHVPIRYDFSEDGLYSEVEVVEYDKDVLIDNLYAVKKGIYMTWNFSGLIKVEESGKEMQYFKLEASETFDHLHKLQGNLAVNPLTGVVDAKVTDDIVEKMKKGENFSFSKTIGAATYTITGTVPKSNIK